MLLTVQQYADMIKVDSSQVRRAINSGKIKAIPFNEAVKIDSTLNRKCRYVDSNTVWLPFDGRRWRPQKTVRYPRLYNIWRTMKQRCNNQNSKHYRYYGAKGIRVCKKWNNSSDEFIKWSLSHGYGENLEIDRIDGSKNYSPRNCRWVTKTENLKNRTYKRYRLKRKDSDM